MMARFLPALVPHLCLLIEHDAEAGFASGLGVEAANNLALILRTVDSSRKQRWSGKIVAATGKAWVAASTLPSGPSNTAPVDLKGDIELALRDLLDAIDSGVSCFRLPCLPAQIAQ
jgi:hypothetical protein